jgi:cytochrome c
MRFLIFVLCLSAFTRGADAEDESPHGFDVLVYSRTAGFRHSSIQTGVAAITTLGAAHDFSVTATEDPAVFSDVGLAAFDVVIFLNTTGDVLDPQQQAALERFVHAGGGWVGVHAAADTEYGWEWYGGLVGAWFQAHPSIQTARVNVLDQTHPSTEHLPRVWTRTDEWYDFRTNPRDRVHVLATLDARSYGGSVMGHDHPIAWCQPYQGGRSWYTGMGHTEDSYSSQEYLDHLLGGIEWAAGVVDGVCNATIGSNFELETLDDNVDSPMDLAISPEGLVFFVEIGGAVKLHDPATGATSTVANIEVAQAFEDGLLGIALDPLFAENNWVYLFYSPSGSAAKQHVSRFEWTGGVLDPSSEVILLEIPTQREECCHSGGAMLFGPDGNLFIALGDNTNPFASDGSAPIDERPGRSPWDAQKSSANTQDLRGKILRIRPTAQGRYEIPEGNLFSSAADGRPEIYVMGVRNPFRISVDPDTGWLYWGDVGPDAAGSSADRGPAGLDEWNQARTAGNYGWPYCVGPNLAYRDWSFATSSSSRTFDCSAPANDSPNNTGASALPPARTAWIWYPYGASTEFPGITEGAGRTAMAGPVFKQDPTSHSIEGLPAYFDGRLIVYEWARNYIRVVTLDDDGAPLSIDPFPGDPDLHQPIAMKAAPDGSLYLLEWGTGFGTGNPDARLSRISFSAAGRRPIAVATASTLSGPVPLEVSFSAAGSFDPDGDPLSYSWDLDGDGVEDASGREADFTYEEAGAFQASLTVFDPLGNDSQASLTIVAGNSRAEISVETPVADGIFSWGDSVPFSLSVSDPDDGSTADGGIDCADVDVSLFVGHDAHTHPLETVSGCEGVLELASGHGSDGDRIFQVVEFTYEDAGVAGAPSIRVVEEQVLLPSRLQAQHYDDHLGVQVESTSDPLGGRTNVGYLDDGDWILFNGLSLSEISHLTFRVASAGTGGRIEVRRGAPGGALVALANVPRTGGWQTWVDVTVPVITADGSGPVYLVFRNNPGDSGLFNVNYLVAHGPGVSDRLGDARGLNARYMVTGESATDAGVEPQLSFDWGQGGYAGDGRAFSATWEASFTAPASGVFTLAVRGQGIGQVLLDSEVRASLNSPARITEVKSAVRLVNGSAYHLEVDYQSAGGAASFWVELEGAGFPAATIGESTTSPAGGTALDDAPELPSELRVAPVYPNPATSDGNVQLALPLAQQISVDLFDVLGRRVSRVYRGTLGPGIHTLAVPLRGLAPGMYYVSVQTAERLVTRTVVKTD